MPYPSCIDQLQDPTGLPGFRRYPFVRDAALDPGEVESYRAIDDAHAAFGSWNDPGLHIFADFVAQSRTPHDRCLRFAPHVTMTHARLAPDPQLREWILSDMSAAPPAVALSAMNNMMSQYITGEAAKIFDEIRIPVITVNGDMWPVNYEANRRHMLSFDAIVLKGADHFLMLNRPEQFNRALETAISKLLRNTVK